MKFPFCDSSWRKEYSVNYKFYEDFKNTSMIAWWINIRVKMCKKLSNKMWQYQQYKIYSLSQKFNISNY